MKELTAPKIVKGGSFLMEAHDADVLFTPEEFTEDDRMMADAIDQFVTGEVLPKVKQLQKGINEDMVALLKQSGELGLLGAEVPEAYGGMAISKRLASLISEKTSKEAGFAVSAGAHTGIGTMPITYFGNAVQKEKYLPRLATGEILAAYALTETSSGSDALNARTRAVLSPDGKHYILNGSKMWITNAGFADIFIVFAKIEGEAFSAFIVERQWEGFSVGAEEKKMGIKSSSTRLITLDDVVVPVENLLGQPGDGSKIAFNILNIGRFKLGGASIGGSKFALDLATRYAIDRKAFGASISSFGLIKHKLGEMAVRTFAQESLVYRTAGYIDRILAEIRFGEEGAEKTILQGIREYAIECCLVKFYCTEALDEIVDEAVQIHGGYGYSQDYDVERLYRDSRINRIFEGTNEINRMLAIDMLLKKTMKGELPLMAKVTELMGLVATGADPGVALEEGLLAEERRLVENAKRVVLFIAGLAVQKFMQELQREQELMASAADVLAEVFAAESMIMRTLKQAGKEAGSTALMVKMTTLYVHDAMERIHRLGKVALAAMEEGAKLQQYLGILEHLVRQETINTITLRREIADEVIAAGGYPLLQ